MYTVYVQSIRAYNNYDTLHVLMQLAGSISGIVYVNISGGSCSEEYNKVCT